MKKPLAVILASLMLISSAACSAKEEVKNGATDNGTVIEINGKNQSLIAYNIEGNNYFKLRDLANVLKDTEAKFDVLWNDEKHAIELISNTSYSTAEEMSMEKAENITPVKSNVVIYLDGSEVLLNAYNIAGNNYFKLRDLASVFDFGVDYDGKSGLIKIDTSKRYEFPEASNSDFSLNTKYLSFKGKTKAYVDEKCGSNGEYDVEFHLVGYNNGLYVGYDNEVEAPTTSNIAKVISVPLKDLFFNCPDSVSPEQIQALFPESIITFSEYDNTNVLYINYCGKCLQITLNGELTKSSYATLLDEPYKKLVGETPTSNTNNSSAYTNVLDDWYKAVSSKGTYCNENNGMYGLGEALMEMSSANDALNSIGYYIEDISGDGTPELLMYNTKDYNIVLAVFTIKNGSPLLVFEGWVRNNYELKNDNTFYHHGSEGASGSCDTIYKLSADGTQLVCVENYFVAPYNNDTGFFKNKTGNIDIPNSEKLNISYDEYDTIVEKLSGNIKSVSLTYFSQYK